jgi:hypothetical protein
MKIPVLFALVFSGVVFASCDKNRLDVDISGIEVQPVKIKRMEKDMFSMNPDSIQPESQKMLDKYGNFYVRFITAYINDGGIGDSTYGYNLQMFIKDRDMRRAYEDCIKKYPALDWLEEDLTRAFRYYRYHFPGKKLPSVVTYMSGFNYPVINADNTLGVGLEMYMGQDYELYKLMGEVFPLYRRKVMDKPYILPDCLKGWMLTENKMDMAKSDFLSTVVHRGKLMYLIDAMLPQMHDTLKIGYTGRQLEWCRGHEFDMWAYLMERNLIYSTDNAEIQKFIMEGPFTAAFSKESPGQVGIWIGWQIVRSYMEKNPEITLEQLMSEKDAQKILTKARYKPEKP